MISKNNNHNNIDKDIYNNYLRPIPRPVGVGLNQIAEIRRMRNLPTGQVHMAGVGGFKC